MVKWKQGDVFGVEEETQGEVLVRCVKTPWWGVYAKTANSCCYSLLSATHVPRYNYISLVL